MNTEVNRRPEDSQVGAEWILAMIPVVRRPDGPVERLRREQHGEDRRVGVADRIDAHPADHRGDRAVRLGFDPGGAVIEAEVRYPWQ